MVDSKTEIYRHSAPRYKTLPWDVLVQRLTLLLPGDVGVFLREEELSLIEEEVARGIRALPSNAPFPLYHNGDFALARLCYILVRVARPCSVVETGVCYGVTSAFLLQALHANGSGCLHSIDLPPLGKSGDEFVGQLIPSYLRSRWRLHRGRSSDVLPELSRELGQIDFFVHDSLHTYRNMQRELEIVTPFLAPEAIVVADDVQGNSAFNDWVSKTQPSYSAILEEQTKQSLLGLAVLPPRQARADEENPQRGSIISPILKGDSPPASSKLYPKPRSS
jgi:predicted O-methyltransferase YrrM